MQPEVPSDLSLLKALLQLFRRGYSYERRSIPDSFVHGPVDVKVRAISLAAISDIHSMETVAVRPNERPDPVALVVLKRTWVPIGLR